MYLRQPAVDNHYTVGLAPSLESSGQAKEGGCQPGATSSHQAALTSACSLWPSTGMAISHKAWGEVLLTEQDVDKGRCRQSAPADLTLWSWASQAPRQQGAEPHVVHMVIGIQALFWVSVSRHSPNPHLLQQKGKSSCSLPSSSPRRNRLKSVTMCKSQ